MSTIRKIWKDVIASDEILKNYPEALEKLRSGNYRAADLDLKVKAHPRVYGIRINDKQRLLFTTITVDGQAYAYVLEVLLDHNYKTCRSMKKNAVSNILNSREAQNVVAKYFSQQTKNEVSAQLNNNGKKKSSYELHYIELDFLDRKWLQLNQTQREVLYKPKPMICLGKAGAGKSTVALAMMAKAVEEGLQPIYLTQSLPLKNEMQANWNDSPYSQGLQNQAVVFATYDELLSEIYQEKKFMDKDECIQWIKNYISVQKITDKKKSQEWSGNLFFPQAIHAEFRVVSGYEEKEYYDLGTRQCGFNDIYLKQWVWQAYQKCCASLSHSAFTSLSGKQYQLILVDESQDFSLLQIKSLCQKAEGMNICFFYDDDQSLHDQISKIHYMKQCMEKMAHHMVTPVELSISYRSAPAIIKVANHLLKLENFLYGGSVNGQKNLMIGLPDDTRTGNVEWPAINNEIILQMKERASSHTCAVITLKSFLRDAREKFGEDAIIFDIENIKGLQFSNIILYRLFDGEEHEKLLRDANNRLLNQSSITTNNNRPKNRDTKIDTYWNNLYTAITRAMENVYIIQEKKHSIKNIANFLLKEMVEHHVNNNGITKTTDEDRQVLANELEKKGHVEQASHIRERMKKDRNPQKIPIQDKAPDKKTDTKTDKKINQPQQLKSCIEYYPEQVSQKTRDFLADFLRKYSEANLEIICCHPKAWQYLVGAAFQPPGKMCDTFLMTELMLEPKYRDRFLNYLCKKNSNGLPNLLAMLPENLQDPVLREHYQKSTKHRDIRGIDLFLSTVFGAVKCNYFPLLKLILDIRMPELADNYYCGYNLLQYASLYSSEIIIKEILSRHVYGLNNAGRLKPHETPLYLAAQNGMRENVVQLIIAGAMINGNDVNLIRTPLMAAVEGKHIEVVNTLLACEAKLPAHLAKMSIENIMSSAKPHFMDYLERRLQDSGRFPIEYHAGENKEISIEYLNNFIAHYSEQKVAELLQQTNALQILFCKKIKDDNGQHQNFIDYILKDKMRADIFYVYLCQRGQHGTFVFFGFLPMALDQAVLIRRNNENQTVKVKYGWWFYRYFMNAAVITGQVEFVKTMLDCLIYDPNLPHNHWCQSDILHLAVVHRHPEIVFVILKYLPIDMNVRDESGKTALHYAAAAGSESIVSLLLLAGANVNGNEENLMETPLMLACNAGHDKVVSLLKECGALFPEEISGSRVMNQFIQTDVPEFPIIQDDIKIRQADSAYFTQFIKNFSAKTLHEFFQQKEAWYYLLFDHSLSSSVSLTLYAHICQHPLRAKIFHDYLCGQDSKGIANIFKLLPENLIAAVIIKQGQDIKTGDFIMSSLVKGAIVLNHYRFLKLVLDSGKVDARDLLRFAAFKKRSHHVSILRHYIADIDDSPLQKPYETALYLAASRGNDILSLLLAGANIDGKDKNYIRTPMLIALQNKQYSTVKLLMMCGAKLPRMLAANSFSQLVEKTKNIEDIIGHLEKMNDRGSRHNTVHSFFSSRPTENFLPASKADKRERPEFK